VDGIIAPNISLVKSFLEKVSKFLFLRYNCMN